SQITSQRSRTVLVNGRPRVVPNTNRLVGAPGWSVLLSKTGFTNDADPCLAMRTQPAGRTVPIVCLGAPRFSQRTRVAIAVARWLVGARGPTATHAGGAQLRSMAPRTVVIAPAPRPSPPPDSPQRSVEPSVEPNVQPAPAGEGVDAAGRRL